MGLTAGGLNGRRFRIDTPLPDGFRDLFLEAVRGNAFVDDDDASDPEPRLGWVNVFDAASSEFELNDLLVDRYLSLSLRADTKKIQAAYLKIALDKRVAAVKAERGIEKLTKVERGLIEEAFTSELLRRALPTVATTDVCWDVLTGHVTVFATSEGALEQVRQLMKETFTVAIRPERTIDWLRDKLSPEELTDRLRALPGGPRSGEDPLEGHELALGSDFLTWLWLQSESSDGLFRVVEAAPAPPPAADAEDGEAGWDDVTESLRNADLTLWIDSRLKLRELHDEDPSTTILLGASPSTTPEARQNLHGGKRPVEASVGLKINDLECSMILMTTPEGVRISGLKASFAVKDGRDEKLLERMVVLDLIQTTLVRLYQQFFLARTSPAWQDRVDRWIAEEEEGSEDAPIEPVARPAEPDLSIA